MGRAIHEAFFNGLLRYQSAEICRRPSARRIQPVIPSWRNCPSASSARAI